MKKYADVEQLLKNLPEDLPYKGSVKRVLIQCPPANVEEVRYGEWCTILETSDSKTIECAVCKENFFFMKKGHLNIDLMPRCPRCGAKMGGKNKNA
jgi:DNA-directed RNA polymerase subunit RPC12/RpoP